MASVFSRFHRLNKLSLRLILIITVIILVAETVILVPSLSRFHHNEVLIEARRQLYLHQVAILHGEQGLASEISPEEGKPRITLKDKVGFPIAAYFNTPDPSPMPDDASGNEVGLSLSGLMGWQTAPYAMSFTLEELCSDDEDLIKLGGNIADIGEITLIVPPNWTTPAIRGYIGRIGVLVLVLVLMVGLPFGLVVEWRVIGPLRRLIESITRFAQSPFDSTAEWEQQNRGIIDEAHNALVSLQHRTQYELAQREKLAALGEAVAKINHDMRNVLSSAVLVSDTLTASNDPKVARAAPLVNGAIDRAITLCEQLLGYLNTAKELNISETQVEVLLTECRRQLDLDIHYDGPASLLVDQDQFFRLIFNLLDNAKKAGAGKIIISVWRTGRSTVIDISDDGPGLPETARAGLFTPFQGSGRGSTGLGLSIARDIAFAHGGDLKLSRTSEAGTEFRLRLPYHVINDTIKKRWWH
jgi:signal transduction histidine kinase